MKILHVVESFATGTLEFIRQIVIGIPEFSHTIYYSERELPIEKAKSLFPNNVRFIRWDFAQREINIKKDFLAGRQLFSFLKSNEFEVIHLHSSKAGFIGRIVCSLLKHNRVLYSPNGVSFARQDISILKKMFFKSFEWIANKFSGQVIAVSNSECDILKKTGIKCVYINNGVDVKVNLKILQKDKNKIRIITMGRVLEQKNPSLFNQIALYFSGNNKIEFIWIGEGNLSDKLFSNNIRITGWVDRHEVNNILENSDVYLSTALWEGLPFSVLESMQYSLPLVLTNCVGNCDLVKEDYNGFLFSNYEDAIKYIEMYIYDEELRLNNGFNSYMLLNEEFNSKTMVVKYKALYELPIITYESCRTYLTNYSSEHTSL